MTARRVQPCRATMPPMRALNDRTRLAKAQSASVHAPRLPRRAASAGSLFLVASKDASRERGSTAHARTSAGLMLTLRRKLAAMAGQACMG